MTDYQTVQPNGNPLSADDLARVEEAYRQLQAPKATIALCKRCNIPVQAAEADCAALEAFFQAILRECRDPGTGITGAP